MKISYTELILNFSMNHSLQEQVGGAGFKGEHSCVKGRAGSVCTGSITTEWITKLRKLALSFKYTVFTDLLLQLFGYHHVARVYMICLKNCFRLQSSW